MRRISPRQRARFVGFALAVAALSLAFDAVASTAPATRGEGDRKVNYLRDVRPILAQHCFQCHGPDDAARKAKLRLDQRESALAERKGKFVIAPRDTANSLVYERITSENERRRMPPEGKAEPLNEKKVETLRLWIEQGADWPEHWAFVPPKRAALPDVRAKEWVRDPIDQLVLAKLEHEGLAPNGEATKEAWLRRASFDLTGLPPTPEELDDFLKDSSADAYAKQADRLLASTRYGERQTQDWLDLARYADTGGYQNDQPRSMWKWREWVINAYNANMPFDQFAVEQLAGDLLPNATLQQKVATGFNRNHPTNSEAGEEEDEYRSVYVIDRVNTTSTVFLGLTLGCSQCHDHKYDPFSQKDYYQLYSFFNNVKERDSDGFGMRNPRPSIPVPNPDQEPRLKDLQARRKVLEKRLEAEDPLADAEQKEWETRAIEKIGEAFAWTTVEPMGLLSRNGSTLKRMEDGSILSTGPSPVRDTYDLVVQPGKRKITALRLEVLPDESQPEKSSGRATDGRFILSSLEVRNSTLSESQDPPLVVFTKGEADLNQEIDFEDLFLVEKEIPGSIDGALEIPDGPPGGGGGMGMGDFFGGGGGWCIVGAEKKVGHEVVLLPRDTLELNDASVLRIAIHQQSQRKYKSLIGRFRVSFTEDERIRKLMLPVLGKAWSSLGPFPAEDLEKAFETTFEPEKEIAKGLDLKKTYTKVVLPAAADATKGGAPAAGGPGGAPALPGAAAAAPVAGAVAPGGAGKDAAKEKGGKPEGPDGASKKPEDGEKKLAEAGEKNPNEKKGDEAASKPGELFIPKAPGFDKGGAEGSFPKKGPGEKKDGKGGDSKVADGKDKKDEKGEGEGARGPKKDDKLAWVEQLRWRDGQTSRLEAKNAAYYLTRKVVCEGARTAVLQIEGPDGVRVWLNGEPVHSRAPVPPKEPKKKDPKDPNAKDEEEDDSPAAIFERLFPTPKEDRKFRLGLRSGENDLVVKAVFAGGGGGGRRMGGDGMAFFGGGPGGGGGSGSFNFTITPEGEDVLNHEVIVALRKEAEERAKAKDAPRPDEITASRPAEITASRPAPVDTGAAAVPASTGGSDTKEPKKSAAGGTSPIARPEPPAAAAAASAPEDAGDDKKDDTKKDDPKKAVSTDEPAKETKLLDAFPEGKVGEIAIEKLQASEKDGKDDKPKLTPAEARAKVIRKYFRSRMNVVGKAVFEELQRVKQEEARLKREIPETMVMEELEKPRQAFVFRRGLYKNKGEKVQANVPSVLPPMAGELPKNRLGLAKWLVDKDHPLTARVAVNRVWRQYFGIGLVRTTDDFGIRGELPSHPELLDWLAVEFVESGWNLKALHRRIVLSATYRQSAVATPEKLEKDPENRFLSRGPRLRLNAEMVRDNALSVSGLLVEKIGGESGKPFQPAGISKAVTGGQDYKKDKGEGQYRRGLYVWWKRGAPYASMLTFDAPKRDTCVVSRPLTTTPLQALTLLNDPVYVECAKMLGQRLLKMPGKDETARLKIGFRLCTSRLPDEAELTILKKLLADQREAYKSDADAAKKLLAVGDAKIDEKLEAAELAAWTTVCNALLNLDETIHKG